MVNVIGLGYIGLPTALMLASNGVEVVGTDYNQDLVNELQAGRVTFKEDGLDELFANALNEGIKFTSEYQQTDIYIISVPTPYDKATKKIDASYVIEAVKDTISVCNPKSTIIIESTISPGTIDKQIRPLLKQYHRDDIRLVHAPERILPGNMIYELVHNNRTIGADSNEVAQQIKELYASFCQGEIVTTDIQTAEMTKVVENTFRAVNIAFANELMRICRYNNMDVYEIIRICNMHPRVNIANPGPGVGGHCIPVDPWFLVGDYPQLTHMINASLKVNEAQPDYVLERIYQIMQEHHITDLKRVGLYGLTYKEDVDDFRESPSLQIIESQRKHLAEPLKCYDPFLENHQIIASQYADFDEFLNSIDLVVVMTKHQHIQQNWDKLQGKIVLDCHNICPLPNAYHL